jgi:hypothetical protein
MKRVVRLTAAGSAVFLLAVVGLRTCERAETPERAYPDAAAARRAGEQARGWLPAFVPATATDVRIAGNVDTNRHWLRFTVAAGMWRALTAAGEPLSLTQVWAADPAAPKWLEWWHQDLRPGSLVPPPGRTPVAAFRHQAAPYCLAADTTGGYVYVWSCRPAT